MSNDKEDQGNITCLNRHIDAWFGGLLECLDDQYHFVCPVCMPPGRGDYFVCFCVLFRLPNVG